MAKKNQPSKIEVINPFGEAFSRAWELWKQYKKEQFRFTYKGAISEQAAINRLVKLSNGDEQEAILLIEYAISVSWQGIYIPVRNEHRQQSNGGAHQSGAGSSANQAFADYHSQRRGGGGAGGLF